MLQNLLKHVYLLRTMMILIGGLRSNMNVYETSAITVGNLDMFRQAAQRKKPTLKVFYIPNMHLVHG